MRKWVFTFFLLSALSLTTFSWAQKIYGLPVGTPAPDFIARNYLDQPVKLSEYYTEGPVVLIFYRGGWCPYCNRHLKELQDNLHAFVSHNAAIIAVSVDTPENVAKTAQENALDFEIISNPSADILTSYNLAYQLSADLKEKYLKEYNIDLEKYSGRTDGIIAVPAVFIIDQTGKIVYAYANEDYKVRKIPQEILDELDTLFPKK